MLKALIVTHVLTREGDLQFTAEMLVYADKFRCACRPSIFGAIFSRPLLIRSAARVQPCRRSFLLAASMINIVPLEAPPALSNSAIYSIARSHLS